MATAYWIVLALRWSVKYFFAPNPPVFRKSLDKGKTNSKTIARRYDIYTLRKSFIRNNDLYMSFYIGLLLISHTTCQTRSWLRLRHMYFKPKNHKRQIKITRPRNQIATQLYGRKLLIVCNHPARFSSHRYCRSGDKTFIIYHVTLHDPLFPGCVI